jgi:hypothetical protein
VWLACAPRSAKLITVSARSGIFFSECLQIIFPSSHIYVSRPWSVLDYFHFSLSRFLPLIVACYCLCLSLSGSLSLSLFLSRSYRGLLPACCPCSCLLACSSVLPVALVFSALSISYSYSPVATAAASSATITRGGNATDGYGTNKNYDGSDRLRTNHVLRRRQQN